MDSSITLTTSESHLKIDTWNHGELRLQFNSTTGSSHPPPGGVGLIFWSTHVDVQITSCARLMCLHTPAINITAAALNHLMHGTATSTQGHVLTEPTVRIDGPRLALAHSSRHAGPARPPRSSPVSPRAPPPSQPATTPPPGGTGGRWSVEVWSSRMAGSRPAVQPARYCILLHCVVVVDVAVGGATRTVGAVRCCTSAACRLPRGVVT